MSQAFPPISGLIEGVRKNRGITTPALTAENHSEESAVPANVSNVNSGIPENLTAAELMQRSAIKATGQELEILAAFRQNMVTAVTLSSGLLRGLERMAIAVGEHLEVEAHNVAGARPSRLLRPLEQFSRITSQLAGSMKNVIEMQRLVLGAPTNIVETRQTSAAGADTAEDADERLRRLQHTAALLIRMGGDKAIEAVPYEGEESNVRQTLPAVTQDGAETDVEKSDSTQNGDLH